MTLPEHTRNFRGIEVAVVDDDPKLRTRLAMQLGDSVRAGAFPSLDTLEEKRAPGTPLVLLLGPSYGDEFRLREVTQLKRRRPEISAIVVVEHVSTELLRQALRAGVDDVLDLADDAEHLIDTIERVAETMPAPLSDPTRRDTTPSTADGSVGRLSTVFSTKGGAGKSVIACNLAVLLARKADGPVAIIDADLQFGDVSVMLSLQPQHTIFDAVSSIDRLDVQLLKSLLIKHEPSGLWVLPAPLEPAFADQVSTADMQKIVKLLLSFCSHVIVDTPAYFNEVILGLLEASDDIVLVAGMDIPHIKNVKIGLQTLRLLNIPSTKLRLVLNRANSKVKLDIAEVERTLQLHAELRVPSEIAVPQSVNKRIPVVLDAPRAGVTRALDAFADVLLNARTRAGR